MALHHVELWVPSLAGAIPTWGWLFERLGWEEYQAWPAGRSWRQGAVYVVLEESPAMHAREHDRMRPGVNHLAFHAGTRRALDDLIGEAPAHGWSLLFADRHPYAGGSDHYAAYLEDRYGYEVELVAS